MKQIRLRSSRLGAQTLKCNMYDRSVENVTAFVLAGGKSSRMGVDKAFLDLDGRTLLARALATGSALSQVLIVGDISKFRSFGTVVSDIYPGCGPLGGIHAALHSTATDFNLMLAVDLPIIGPEFLRYLFSQAVRANAVVTVPRCGGVFQPLCAVYRKQFAPVAERSLLAGQYQIGALFREVKVRVLEEDELIHAGFGVEIFRNLNTPQEWAEAKLDCEKRR